MIVSHVRSLYIYTVIMAPIILFCIITGLQQLQFKRNALTEKC